MMNRQEKLAYPFAQIKATGWQCMSCKNWNAINRHKCWNCEAPPETREALHP